VLYIRTLSGREVVVVLEAARHLSDTDRALVEIFCSRLSIAFDNVILYEQLQRANTRLEERVAQRTQDLTTANRRLAAQWARLRQANTFKSEILGTIAHDLKNPLGVILGRAEILKEMIGSSGAIDAGVQAQLAQVRSAANQLTQMVDDLVADAMADALDITIRREPVDISLLVEEAAEANRPLAEKKQQIVTVTAPPNHAAMCDADRIREAIDNLVSNAIKYSPIGGSIGLVVTQAGGGIMVQVRDQGPGLSPEDITRLFGRFQRLSAKPTAGESSTGLGLSIVKRIVDLHGGQITVESAGPGKGATFKMTLPVT
jgi:signal transduction histidine kinase